MILEKEGIKTVLDLLEYFPRDYETKNMVTDFSQIRGDQKNIFKGLFRSVKRERTKRGFSIVKGIFTEHYSGSNIECIWFNTPRIEYVLPVGETVYLEGKAKLSCGKISLQSPVLKTENIVSEDDTLSPLYSELQGIKPLWFQQKIAVVLEELKKGLLDIPEILPKKIRREMDLLSRSDAILIVHNPENKDLLNQAKQTFIFEELLVLQLQLAYKKKNIQSLKSNAPAVHFFPSRVSAFFETLPFVPTNAQKVAIFEILKDLEKGIPMQRMLEGDVGSGKTLVALVSAVMVIMEGFECAFLAPTEILAQQHYKSIVSFFNMAREKGFFEDISFPNSRRIDEMLFPNIELLTSSIKGKKRKEVLHTLSQGGISILVGTHALIEENVIFNNLGLVIIDEQHRFGVKQRERLIQKGNPHVLQMSATPIPRSLAMVAFGDQDLSVLAELPPGRKTITTRVVSPEDRRTVDLFIDDQIQKGRQVFVVCPLVEESEKIELKAATDEFLRLQEYIFPKRKVGLLHGKMSSLEKENVMEAFKNKEFDILVSTSVVEVGVDVPNATVMLIEGAERFGLSQLHQFRGRVGRGGFESYCFLCPTNKRENQRLSAMEKTNNGFELAEIDMRLRGPGEVYGVRQSGVPDMKMAHFLDGRLLVKARKIASHIIDSREIEDYEYLKKEVEKKGVSVDSI